MFVLRAVSSERSSHGQGCRRRSWTLWLFGVRQASSSSREIAALERTEALLRVTSAAVTNECYQNSAKEFNESELAFLTAAIASITGYNRIAMAYRFTPPIPQDRAEE